MKSLEDRVKKLEEMMEIVYQDPQFPHALAVYKMRKNHARYKDSLAPKVVANYQEAEDNDFE